MIIIKPRGRLCNRLRAIDSAIALTAKHELKLHVIWEMNWECNCKFSDLFIVPRELSEIKSGYILNILNRIAPLLFSHFNNYFLDQNGIEKLTDRRKFFDKISSYNNVYINSHSGFYRRASFSSFSSLNPRASIQDIIKSYRVRNMIGVHVRRTDNMNSISYSPIEKFIEHMNNEIRRDNNAKFFLATDDLSVETELREIFPDKIITHSKKSLDRNNPLAIQNAVIDLYCLANCRKLIGSYWSSFSYTAAEIYRVDRTIIKNMPSSGGGVAMGNHSLMIRLNPEILVYESDAGDLLVETEAGKQMQLNNTSAAILNVCYQSMTITEMLSLFRSTYPDAPESLEKEIVKVLEVLFTSNIIDVGVAN
jgi:hypothetical protein